MEHNECRTLWVLLKPDTTERTAIGHAALQQQLQQQHMKLLLDMTQPSTLDPKLEVRGT